MSELAARSIRTGSTRRVILVVVGLALIAIALSADPLRAVPFPVHAPSIWDCCN